MIWRIGSLPRADESDPQNKAADRDNFGDDDVWNLN
jgi:hypothetical protein